MHVFMFFCVCGFHFGFIQVCKDCTLCSGCYAAGLTNKDHIASHAVKEVMDKAQGPPADLMKHVVIDDIVKFKRAAQLYPSFI